MKNGCFALQTKNGRRAGLRAAVALALIGFAGGALADPGVTMAPPVDSGYSQSSDGRSYDNTGGAVQDSVFQWQEVPQDQQVPIRRAVFDRGGYQLYDTQGETIVIPFTDNNLYVMKFARSTDGKTYFVNGGDAPVLYVPRNGFLENAAVPGARWYPFSEDFHPAEPVFLGVAPSWDDYIGMGWYPGMVCNGGYWGYHPYVVGSVFFPSFGLSFVIGGHRYNGWEPYHRYYDYHPAPYHVTIINRNVYRYDGRNYREHDFFRGTGRPYEVHRDFNNDHRFAGGFGSNGSRDSGDRHGFGGGRGANEGRIFRGTGHPTYAHRDYPGSRDAAPDAGHDRSTGGRPVFGGGGHSSDGGTPRSFPGAVGSHTFPSGGDMGSVRSGGNRTFGGNSRPVFGGRDASNDSRPDGGTHTFGGGGRTFGGGNSRPTGGGQEMPAAPVSRPENNGTHTFGGGSSGSVRSNDTGNSGRFNGGERTSGGGGGQRTFGGGGGDRPLSRPPDRSSQRPPDKSNDRSLDKSSDRGGRR